MGAIAVEPELLHDAGRTAAVKTPMRTPVDRRPMIRRIAVTAAIALTVIAADAAVMRFLRYSHGLKGEFTVYRGIRRIQAFRLVKAVDYQFEDRPPITGFPARDYLIRLSGDLIVPEDGLYEFGLFSEGRVRLMIGGATVIQAEYRTRAEMIEGRAPLKRGRQPIRIEYAHRSGAGALKLYWRRPGTETFEIIPARRFKPELPIPPSSSPSTRTSKTS